MFYENIKKEMGYKRRAIFAIVFIASFYVSNGCQMEGVIMWPLPVSQSILDTHTGTVLNRSTTNIEGINTISYGEGLNAGPYLEVSHTGSQFLMWTNEAYANYEENEVTASMSITVTFRCTGGSVNTLVLWINVIDTNNNAPQFRPNDEFEFTIATPVPPGFLVTGCLSDMTVRDIDLTTQRIDFEIEENPYFEIAYDSSLSTVPKEFKAVLRTTTFIRTLPETVTLKISATDVDLTGDPPITTNATIRVSSDTEFEFPEEPVFSQAFYLANYTEEHQVLHEPISLRQGYSDLVQFSLEGEHTSNFALVINGNQISINVTTPLSVTVLAEKQTFLIIRAEREFTSGGFTTVVLQFPEEVILEFEKAHYDGRVVNNSLQLPQLILSQGYGEASISAHIISEYSSYFNATVEDNIVTVTMAPLSESIILDNNFIHLQIIASTDRSSATTIVTLEVIKDDHVTPVFNRPIYTGMYDPVTGLTTEQIFMVQGFDETVTVHMDGDFADFFQLIQEGPVINLTSSTLPPEIYGEQHLLLSIEATKPRTVGANAAVVIALPEARELDFDASAYKGSLQDNVLTLETIVLGVGYDESVNFSLIGDHASYFTVTNVQNQVTLNLSTPLPDNVILENNHIILTLKAFGPNAITTTASVVLEIIKQDLTTPLFGYNIYYGTYIDSTTIDVQNINLVQGYDDTVSFRIDGEHSQYFRVSNAGNNVLLSLQSAIPENLIFSEKVLSFNILADKPLTVGANAAVLIRFPTELTDSAVMRFSQNTFFGSLENELLTIENIILNTGYATGTQFLLSGDLAAHFAISNTNNVVSISLHNTLPTEVTEQNKFIILEVQAQRDRAVPVWASVVIDIVKQDIVPPVFSEAYYRGIYTEDVGLQFTEQISLSSGYDETVSFDLEGDLSMWFSLVQINNSLTVTLNAPIPQSIMEDHNQLLFVVAAFKPNAKTGRAAISIDLPKEIPDPVILNFDQNAYVGKIEDGVLELPTITLLGNNSEANVTMAGDYASYFNLSQEFNVIKIEITNNLPNEIVYENAFIVLNLEATYPNAISGHSTIVIGIIKPHVTETPVFSQAYYTGEYSLQAGLQFEYTIHLIQGFDESTSFTLAGDDAQWFGLVENGQNNLTLSLIAGSISLENRSHLTFSVVANNPDNLDGHAAIIISLTDFSKSTSLRFSQDYYAGIIEDGNLTLNAISLEEGYTANVTYILIGDHAAYFQLTNQDGIFTLQLLTNIPDTIIEANNILILTLEAAAENARTHATIILEIIKDIDNKTSLLFEETYYTGSYSYTEGLIFGTPMRLAHGYDDNVIFSLEGNSTQWFGLLRTQNSVMLTLTSPIPAAVITNNQQLIFIITAQRTASTTARATVVISLTDEFTEDMGLLGFERITYLGSIQNNTASIEPIILNEGFTTNVSFTLHGALAQYFGLSSVGPVVTIVLQSVIPEEAIPDNRIIILEVQASAPQAMTAYATVVFAVTNEDDVSSTVQLAFNQTYYTGSYNVADGLSFETAVTISNGYDDSVQFALEGEHAQWFGLLRSQNSVTLTLTSPIPAAVLMNNQKLIFVITAQRPGSTTARATVVIALTDEFTEGMGLLGFERITYLGSIQNNTASIEPIILNEGFTTNVSFTLHGALAQYFGLSSVGPVVTIVLQSVIPEEAIPDNRIIILEVQASAPQAMTAYATVVFAVTNEDDVSSTVQLAFNQTYYTGSYNVADGLSFETAVTISNGYDDSVQFALEGEHAQWFGLLRSQNSVTLTLTSPIPAAVLMNNQKLIFVITAHRPGSTTARATVVIALTDEFTEDMGLLGFERITYLGSIQNNTASIEPIILNEGFTTNVSFTLHGALAQYFGLSSVGPVVTIVLQSVIPEEAIPDNRIIILEVQASAPQAMTAYATVVFAVTNEDDVSSTVQLAFNQTYYTGSYNVADGLSFETAVTISNGYDDSVQFALEGEHAQWFGLLRSQNSVTLTLTSPIPAAVLMNNQKLIFVITAHRPGSTTARATVVIALTDEFTEDMGLLGFERITYLGSIQNNTASIEPIILNEGFTTNVSFTLHGALAQYFGLSSVGPVVTIVLQSVIPEEAIPDNRIIILEVQASAPQAMTAYATVVFAVTNEDDVSSTVQLAFNQTYYTGSYNVADGLSFETAVTISNGYDDSVQFALEGEHAQWFGLLRSQNSVTLTLTSPIPAAVLMNNQKLIFVITAQRPGSTTARATVVIALTDEFTEDMGLLGFERITYLGSIQNNTASIEPIILNEGFTTNVSFTLHGALAQYFGLSSVGPVVTIVFQSVIPEEAIPDNRIIILEVQASAPQAMTAYATVVFAVTNEDDVSSTVQLAFNQTYYTGSYNVADGLSFETAVTISNGYDDSVQFALEGEHAQWFGLLRSQNSVTLTLTSPIPAAVLMNNQKLIFVITAQRPGSTTARATVVIALTDEFTEDMGLLGFERITYLGSIQNNTASIEPIILNEGFTTNVSFTLHGALAQYFGLSSVGPVVTIVLQSVIPEEAIPDNRIIILEVQASAPQAMTAYATVVFAVTNEDDVSSTVQLAFNQTYYTGSYNVADGLSFETAVTISNGYDDSVQFALEGEHAQWFGLLRSQNSVTLTLTSPIPAAVLMNNQKLIFVITAQRPGSTTARATVVIALTDEFTEDMGLLGFERITYLGSIQNNTASIEPIILNEGFTTNVSFTLHGALAQYFGFSSVGPVVTIVLQSVIPEEAIPDNQIIILEVQASAPQAMTAYATVVFAVTNEDDVSSTVQLAFNQTYYTGSYNVADGLSFETAVTISNGYDDSVQFALEGEHAQWFGLLRSQNSVTLTLTSPIPAAVLMNNQKLIFVITAQRPGSTTARATVVIALTDEFTEDMGLLGFERITYLGSIQNNTASIEPIILNEGFTTNVSFTLHGALAQYFGLSSVGPVVTIVLQSVIPEEAIPDNRIIILEVQASAPQAMTAYATVVFAVTNEDDVSSTVQLAFNQTYYTGSYNVADGLSFETAVTISNGYDDSVQFALEGEHAQWFGLLRSHNSVTLTLTSPIPAAVLMNNQKLIFVITAQRPGSTTARATVVIALTDEFTEDMGLLGFERITYLGSIQNNTASIEPIILNEGFTTNVSFTLHGALAQYFGLSSVGPVVTIVLQSVIPEEAIPDNRIIILEVQASAPQAMTAYATVVFAVTNEDDVSSTVQLAFNQTYYTGSYNVADGLSFETAVTISNGYDDSVQFALEGEHAQWFGLLRSQNSVTLTLTSPIPAAVLMNNQKLIFVITAQRPGSTTARATVVIALTDEFTEDMGLLGFERITYLGSIQNNTASIEPIILNEGFTTNVSFTLHGALAQYFGLSSVGPVVTIVLQSVIPEEAIPDNRIIILEVQASAPQAMTAYATVVFAVTNEDDVSSTVQLAFNQTYYTGSYNVADGLSFETAVTISNGYDDSVQFALEGEHAQWFGLLRSQNSVTLTLTSPIPAAVLMNNQKLIFVITAQRPGSTTARATVVIALTDEFTEDMGLLGFERITYLGSIQNNTASIEPIILNEGFTTNVSFTLHGALAQYFGLSSVGPVVTIVLQSVIPEEAIPDNRIIILEVQASAPQAMTAYATVVFAVTNEDDVSSTVQLAFNQTYYTGSYNVADGLSFETAVTISNGYDDSVQFALEGEHAQWFGLLRSQNSVTLTLTSPIPAAVLMNNQKLIFVITAQRPGSTTARATVVIALTDEFTEDMGLLGFERITYLGSIQNNTASIEPIILNEGFTTNVSFTLHGALAQYFGLSSVGPVVTIVLQSVIPEEAIPDNRIIILEVQASAPQAMTAYATVVFAVTNEDDVSSTVQLAFNQTYYTGSYNVADGLSFETAVTISNGYDDSVQFALEGEHAQWFGLLRSQNSVTLTLTSPIPAAVLMNNQKLIFVITAQRPGSTTARATVVIALTDEFTEDMGLLGFERITYLGSIQNNTASIEPIILNEGFTTNVSFTLHGALAQYFGLSSVGPVVTIVLQSVIPEEAIPDNRIIILEVQASAPQAMTAYATVVFAVTNEDDVSSTVQLAFNQTYYTGSYNVADGLSFETAVTISNGYDDSVQFALEGEHAQWFGLLRSQNSVTLTLTSPIPAAVLMNNQKLIFVITAHRPGSTTARATVVIALTDEFTEDMGLLGFERITYLGSIQNNTASIEPIILNEGFTTNVSFTLHGALAQYFGLSSVGPVVTIVLQSVIPEEAIPDNRIIILEVQASAPQAMTAYATVVFAVTNEDDVSSTVQLAFNQTYYTGSYNVADGLSFETAVTISNGYDDSVQFALEGEHAQWFGLLRSHNSVTLTLTSPIPAAVLMNNQKLIFVITAQRPGSTTARATVVIALTDEFTEDMGLLGFERITYLGSIQNNTASIEPIILNEGFTTNVSFTLHGALAQYFGLSSVGPVVTIVLQSVIPEEAIPDNRIIILEVQASAPQAMTAYATVVFAVTNEDDVSSTVQLAFNQTYYTGSYNVADGLSFETAVTISNGYVDSVQFALEGEHAQWFGLLRSPYSVTLTLTSPIPAAVLMNNQKLIFVITAQRPGSTTARATVVIALTDEFTEDMGLLGFERITYLGSIQNNTASIEPIILNEGFTTNVSFTLHGALAQYFGLSSVGPVVTIVLQSVIPEEAIPDNRIIILEVQASAPQAMTAYATVVFAVTNEDDVSSTVQLAFNQTYYTGSYNVADGLSFETAVTISNGYDDSVQFALEGEHAQWFGLLRSQNSVTLTLTSPIPAAVLMNNQKLIFVITAQRPGSTTARATVVIALFDGSQVESDLRFENVLYEGIIQNNTVRHEVITLHGFNGTNIQVIGEYASLFVADVSDGVVWVRASGSVTLPDDVTHVVLELHATPARAVLLLNMIPSGNPAVPSITFDSSSYAVRVDVTQSGIVGRVQATADNGESVGYTLVVDNAHLLARLSVNNEGELHLSAPANSGVYTFRVVATTVFTQATGTATVHLTVDAVTVCGGDGLVVPPLIILDRDEEEPHNNLVVLNGTLHQGCRYTLTNRWPANQTWLYADDTGLHTRAINREHESIAFMALSQVQVELTLHCESDNTRTKRSLSGRTDWLGPYDYGTSNWILTDTILYNSRRSLVNLIVNDINDNAPIFDGKENEPITVGYPVPELEEIVLPRSLAELHATDADIGVNAALVYWSSEAVLAVAPSSGFVHIRDGGQLENGMRLNVHATDRNGEGLTGSIELLVRLLDVNNIVVVSVRNAFLDDERSVLAQLSSAVGYDVRALRSSVISNDTQSNEVDSSRKKRETGATGATLQLHVYGLIEREPVAVEQLTADITNNAIAVVNIASTVSLEDHLEGREICVIPGRDTGLLVATILLSILLFILIVVIAVWFILRRRKKQNYEQFSDQNSLASRNESLGQPPKPESVTKPRLNIEELKKSERRLQEMLDAPVDEVQPTTSRKGPPVESILDIPPPDSHAPIVIQSIDKLKDATDESDNDEFGETDKPRKSVVTFNENVEKIIHVEDDDDSGSLPGYEIFRL